MLAQNLAGVAGGRDHRAATSACSPRRRGRATRACCRCMRQQSSLVAPANPASKLSAGLFVQLDREKPGGLPSVRHLAAADFAACQRGMLGVHLRIAKPLVRSDAIYVRSKKSNVLSVLLRCKIRGLKGAPLPQDWAIRRGHELRHSARRNNQFRRIVLARQALNSIRSTTALGTKRCNGKGHRDGVITSRANAAVLRRGSSCKRRVFATVPSVPINSA